jgi:ubiquitin carboxyl-terminal hydrolase 10
VTDTIELLQKHDSVYAIEDALARISHLQPVELGPSGLSEASQQVLVEALPSVLVLHLKRFLYDVVADGIVKISKAVRFAPELEILVEIPLGTISPLFPPC